MAKLNFMLKALKSVLGLAGLLSFSLGASGAAFLPINHDGSGLYTKLCSGRLIFMPLSDEPNPDPDRYQSFACHAMCTQKKSLADADEYDEDAEP